MAEGLWWRSQSGSSSNVRRVGADAPGSGDEAVPGEATAEHVANGSGRRRNAPRNRYIPEARLAAPTRRLSPQVKKPRW